MLNFENDWRQFEQVVFMNIGCCFEEKTYLNYELRFRLIVYIKSSVQMKIEKGAQLNIK